MAFADRVAVMYEGSVRVTYLDRPHAYYKQDRVDYGLPESDDKAWGSKTRPKGVTTILGDTLEKKGLMTWPLGLALTELFGFYDFEPEPGKRLTGFSKGKGTLWKQVEEEGVGSWVELNDKFTKDELTALVLSASKAWQRKQKQGADIGSLVHDAIEQYVLGTPFPLTLEKYAEGQDFSGPTEQAAWFTTAEAELAMAVIAFERFKMWWAETQPELINAEQIVYSKEYDYAGAYDALLRIDGRTVLVDWKTSKASVSAGAPQGIYYSYWAQSAAYACALMEMGEPEIHDLMVVSARKDGGFAAIFLSDLGVTMPEIYEYWKSILTSHRMMVRLKKALVKSAELAAVS